MSSAAEHFDAVVVGSGFGGAVAAYRLAQAGRTVCVLERGKPYPPGSFPRSPHEMRTNFWDPTHGLHGLFDFWSFHGLDALVCSGLGGGSLIYANVLLRKDERWFVQEDLDAGGFEYWPVTRDDLDPHYDRVEAMLHPQRFPADQPPYDAVPKTRAFRDAADRLGYESFLPNLAVTFANDGDPPMPGELILEAEPNLHGATRFTCRLCGECDLGCNYGSKNTLDYNYLSAAQRAGAEIRTRAEVRVLKPRDGGGYSVRYVDYAAEPDGPLDVFDPALSRHEITTDRLVLAGGTLGTTRLLLRNRAAFPRISEALGTRFCGNGDLLTFATRCSEESAGARTPRVIDPGYGPVITSAVRVPDALDGGEGRGFYVEDAGLPGFANWLLHVFEAPGDLWRARGVVVRLMRERLQPGYRHTGRSAVLSQLLGEATASAGLLPLLVMGRDVPDGRMSLRDNHLQVDWRKGSAGRHRFGRGRGRSGPYFDRARAVCRQIADELGGGFRDNPLWFLSRVITVHPLGGCPMGRTRHEGVVDPHGQVFGYPGMFIVDGSVMPGPVGPNPSLTIAALADRFADRMTETQMAAQAIGRAA
jgi:cholesterol oxidase